ncbi:hypothetical protein C2S52_005707 [Perilla frutescens var. hirtella]|uniref:Pectinesterase inhibitor domain-containing protein n=1 Tax=Perilla frutescens var. hirtella TaxID=608512 RepID=A0AAD4PBJ3_PERFH|nr:hypothetical protein C2S51_010026 [Perilla frutescens var. frutescens]KAH6795230.1 hypothetical protein C2S52_005707 [Perilla frutescens var. hirtella]KAH6833065.1 hypothetical protein C2S53_005013 [Perilla frutescens var. hirtella]
MVSARNVNDQNLIETTCKNTPDYNLCTAIIRADPKSAAAELQDLGLIVVAAIKKRTQQVMATIDSLTKTSPKNLLPPLKQCRKYYNAVLVGNIPVAEQTVWGNPKFAETAMADTKNEAEWCEEQFQGVAPSPLTADNKYVADAAAVARGIIRNLL